MMVGMTTHRALPPYADLYFGKTDSHNELVDDRGEFVKSFVNLDSTVENVIGGSHTLVLGPKGTGKSALAWYLETTSKGNDYFAQVKDASNLPLADIPQLETGQPAGAERTVTAWRFILLCNYLEVVLQDQSARVPNSQEVRRVTAHLRKFGLMGGTTGKAILSVAKTTIQIPIPKLGTIYKRESSSSLTIFALLPYLEEWAANVMSGNRHVLLLDGLDSIFLNDQKYDESMASLVQAAYMINQRFARVGASGSIVLLLRNDVFSRVSLRLPDSQKMRDDSAIELDWRVLSGARGVRSPLMKLVNEKAAQAAGHPGLEVLSYFPQSVEVARRRQTAPRQISTLRYLLNMTRHTPRDLLRLFEEIRRVEAGDLFEDSPNGKLDQDVIREGVLQYSNRYFVNAIRNEFAGFSGGPDQGQAALSALQSLTSQLFDRRKFSSALADLGYDDTPTVDRLLKLLFFAGAIGNYVRRSDGQESYLQFYHRRDDAEIYLKGGLIMHGALCHAWNISFAT
jgi:hypothetical protein